MSGSAENSTGFAKFQQLIKFLTFRSVHFHPSQCARPSFSIFRGSGSETTPPPPPRQSQTGDLLPYCSTLLKHTNGTNYWMIGPPKITTHSGLFCCLCGSSIIHLLIHTRLPASRAKLQLTNVVGIAFDNFRVPVTN